MEQEFDHVVVGGGAAGCVLAARLTEDPGCRVLLLEAGGDGDDPAMTVPLRVVELQDGPANWQDVTTPQPGLGGRSVPIGAGRGIGGGGSINFMAWFRGNHADYDGWAAAGMKGWAWEDVLPRFRRGEDHELGASHWHGTGGPIPVTTARDINPLSLSLITAGVQCGHPFNRDVNGATQDGFGLLYSNIRDGERVDAGRGYLRPALDRPNLTVRTGSPVRRILLDGDAARGVVVRGPDGAEYTVTSPSVVLCAGGFRSPQLLMASGIGPAEHLERFGIDVLADLPGVGANLHDHPTAWLTWPVEYGTSWADANTPAALERYRECRGGPLASVGQATAFLRCAPDAPAPDIQLSSMLMDLTQRHEPSFSVGVTLLTPRSRGTVRLASPDVDDAPVVDPDLLGHPDDAPLLAAGVREALRVGRAPALAAVLGEIPFDPDTSAAVLTAFVRDTSLTLNHPVGTCRAGVDDEAVVDPELRVHGVRGLRVIDSSVMPTTVRANTHATSIMIGERGSDLLRGPA